MSDKFFISTRKGLFTVCRNTGHWEIAAVDFLGDPTRATDDVMRLSTTVILASSSTARLGRAGRRSLLLRIRPSRTATKSPRNPDPPKIVMRVPLFVIRQCW